jgi:hypothetical protein
MNPREAKAFVESLPANVRAALIAGEKERREVIRRLAALSAPRYIGATREEKEQAREDLKPLRAWAKFVAAPLEFRAGSIGTFSTHTVGAEQIIDAGNVIAYRLKNYGRDREFFWLSGFATDGIADGQEFRAPGVWIVNGTRSYTATDRAKRTLLLFEPFDVSPYWTPEVGKAIAKLVDEGRAR